MLHERCYISREWKGKRPSFKCSQVIIIKVLSNLNCLTGGMMTIIANVLKGQLYPFDHCHMPEVHKRKTTLHNLCVVFEDNYFKNK